jgi:hypothetical protein
LGSDISSWQKIILKSLMLKKRRSALRPRCDGALNTPHKPLKEKPKVKKAVKPKKASQDPR